MLFTLKKLIGNLLMPLPAGALVLLIALVIYLKSKSERKTKIANRLVIGVISIWLLLSFLPFARLIMAPLEYRYPQYAGQAVNFIVVLGGYHQSDSRTPISSLLSPISLQRLVEGIRIHRLNQNSKLILSGYASGDEISQAEAMRRVALILGVEDSNIITEPRPRDTREEAGYISERINDHSFALVTSASHMPRAVLLFRQQGLNPVPAPTAFLVKGNINRKWHNYLPNSRAITMASMAWHEYLGVLWIELQSLAD